MTDRINYDNNWVENELKHMEPHEYVKRYKHIWKEHTFGAVGILLWKLAEEMSQIIEKVK